MKLTEENWEEEIKSVNPNDIDAVADLSEAIESLMNKKEFDLVEKILYKVSSKALLHGILYSDECNLEFFKKFIDYKFDVNIGYWKEDTETKNSDLLWVATLQGYIEIMDYMIKEKGTILSHDKLFNLFSDDGLEGNSKQKRYLLDSGIVDINFGDGKMLLWALEAAQYSEEDEDVEFVKYLLEKGADISTNDFEALFILAGSHLFIDLTKDLIKSLYNKANSNTLVVDGLRVII